MSLKAFNYFFVSFSILLCMVLGGWGIRAWWSEGDLGQLWFGGGWFLAAAGLLAYGRYVLKKLSGMSYL
jgi:hypothetical protein